MNSIPISEQGFARVKEELEKLKSERPAVIEAIALAREEGDLKENAGYDAARERQGMLEAKINYIESRLPLYDVIDLKTLNGERIIYGATVELEDLDTEEEKIYTLVGPDEIDWVKNGISILSPVARALLGKEEGDEVVVDTPRGRLEYEVVSVNFLGDEMMQL